MPGQIRTVTGDLPADQLGLTLMHEHLYTDLRPLKTREEVPVPTEEAVEGAEPTAAGEEPGEEPAAES